MPEFFFLLLTVIFFQPKTVPEIGLKYKNNFVFSTNYYFNQKYVIFLYKLCKIINKNWNYIKEFLNPDRSCSQYYDDHNKYRYDASSEKNEWMNEIHQVTNKLGISELRAQRIIYKGNWGTSAANTGMQNWYQILQVIIILHP